MALTEMQQKWVDALRSGKYKQGKQYLYRDGKYCCLGVACEVAGQHEPQGWSLGSADFNYKKVFGLRSPYGDFIGGDLMELNDEQSLTFEQIADIIESEPEGLFDKEQQND